MSVLMDKVRVGIFLDEEIRAALKSEAAFRNLDMSELAESILRDALQDAIEHIRKKREAEAKRKGRTG